MLIFPAIDLYQGKAVRLYQGDYNQMTVYSDQPVLMARDFAAQGAKWIHLVDLEGAKTGGTPNLETIKALAQETDLCTEVGGGIRNMDVVRTYLNAAHTYFGADALPLYASKALCFTGIYKIAAEEGMGVDCVSGGELYTAKRAGFPAERIYFHGNNKTERDIDDQLVLRVS